MQHNFCSNVNSGAQMRLKTVGLVVLAMLVLGVTASASFALPDISLLAGDTFPVTATAANTTVATSLETAVGSKLSGVGFKASITCTELSSLCKYAAEFKGVKEGKNECKSAGGGKEVVIVEGEVHVVYVALSTLADGALFLVPALEILCGSEASPDKVKIKVEGSVLGSLTATLGSDIETFSGTLKGSKGKQELTKYFNDAGTEVAASLKANFGLGLEGADENVAEAVTFTPNKMLIISG
jgi:hypothetical protein